MKDKYLKNIDIEDSILAKHFESRFKSKASAQNSVRRARKEYFEGENNNLWELYVKAYNWDTRDTEDEEPINIKNVIRQWMLEN